VALRNILSVVCEASVNVSTLMQRRDLVGPPLAPGESGACHPVREAMLLGFCQLRFGAVEAVLYETIMARIERRQHADPPRC
jgi:hypothetical protein